MFRDELLRSLSLFNNNTALCFNEKCYTYNELNVVTDNLASYLSKDKNILNSNCIVYLKRTDWLVISIIAIIKAGGVFSILDAESPKDTLSFAINILSPIVIVDDNFIESFKKGEQKASFDVDFGLVDKSKLYILFTSGSTGVKKAVVVGEESLMNYLTWCRKFYFKDGDQGNFSCLTSPGFDLTFTSMFYPLIFGKTVTIYPQFKWDFLINIKKAILNDKVDSIKLTPTHISLLDRLNIKSHSVKSVILGGEKVMQYHIDILKRVLPFANIYNEYGPTEATIGCIAYKIPKKPKKIYIGRPIDNTDIMILRHDLNICKYGEVGEIYIGGKCLSSGYLAIDSSEKFVRLPQHKNRFFYKSGDLAIKTSSGLIDFIGRGGDEIKVNSIRTSISEIEYSITRAFPSITKIKVEKEDAQLILYYENKFEITVAEFIKAVSFFLHNSLIPKRLVLTSDWGMNSNGKYFLLKK